METTELTIEELQNKLKEMEESRDYWMKRHNGLSKKFDAFRESIKSVIVLVD